MITNIRNNRIKEVTALLTKHKARQQSGLFVVEGIRMMSETPISLLKEVFVSESFSGRPEMSLMMQRFYAAADVPVNVVSDQAFSRLSDTLHPQGILAVAHQPSYDMEAILDGKYNKENFNGRFLVLESVQDPGNVGTMLRTAEAAGMDAVLLGRGCADIFNPKTIRSTMGSLFRQPFAYFDDMRALLDALGKRNIRTYAAALDGSVEYTEADLGKGGAVFIGNEGAGLLPETAAGCDERIRIPMEGMTESLNAAVSAAILMYEMKRQADGR
ncbi:MAG: RNA methyltransferase [Lachnospiraceae bacterium]|nr:RNA methyltransferase [Lachnospiraceae bacterium]